ncbi:MULTISPECIES: DMT family transporter [Pontibacillus]|uniref:Multidrug efflux SMR transporter n=1 Tax=Pontibacillus chungwhensis TaxID=265426 RepID=A0ABY8V2Q0_9BACI|nr:MULTISPECIES: multidrug efflux SMR transporter [Pontibacillus]MCD5322243.1 multidrug efflux SMR transporter [Pontibacillus sp. HN14]WIF99537.1 multidrug efflux SMR transporter [Pontibacillus chungwhensis]
MGWTYVIVAGLLEIIWIFTMKQSEGFTVLVPSVATVILLVISFFIFSKAMEFISVGTAYAVFTGIGTVGAVTVEFIMNPELVSVMKVFFILILLTGILGLKVTEKEETEGSEVSH